MMQPNETINPILGRPLWISSTLHKLRYKPWFRGKEFSADFASAHFPIWSKVLSPFRGCSIRILEIGSWEGRSAIFFLNFFPRSTIVCIDTFGGSGEQHALSALKKEAPHIENRFDHNMAPFCDRVEKIKSLSIAALERLARQSRQFDLAYIDGSHRCEDVAADTLRAWPLVAPSGIVIWDDYGWRPELQDRERPQPAIDAFLRQHKGRYRLLAKGYQIIVQRIASSSLESRGAP